MKKMVLRIAYAVCVLGLFSSCLQTPSLSEDQLGSSFDESNMNPNIDPTTGLPYVNQPKQPDSAEPPKLSSGSSPSSSGKAPVKVVNKSGSSPSSSGSAPSSDDIEAQNKKDMALYEQMLKDKEAAEKAKKEEQAKEESNSSGSAPEKKAPAPSQEKKAKA